MMGGTRSLLAGILLLITAALALQAVAGAQTTILLKDGRQVKGWLVADDGNKVTIRLDTGGEGVARTSFRHDQLDPRTMYRLMLGKTRRDDPEGQMKLAAYALDHHLFEKARRHYRIAKREDEKLGGQVTKELEKLRGRAAGVVLAWSREQLNGGDVLGAEKWLGVLLVKFPNTPEADQARRLLDQMARQAMEARERIIQERARERSEKAEKALPPAKAHYDKAHAYKRKGLQSTNQHTKAIREFKSAIAEFERAQKQLQVALKKAGGDEAFQARVASYEKAVRDDVNATRLNMAGAYLERRSYKNAMAQVNKVLADDPGNEAAVAMRARIETAEADDDLDSAAEARRVRQRRGGARPGRPGVRPRGGRR
jgi:tetratricopeptide (TPR) repeat protein